MKLEIHDIFIKTKLDKACFQHDTAYGDFKCLNGKTTSDKVLHDKSFNIIKNLKYDGYQKGLASMVYKFFDKKILVEQLKKEDMSKKELTDELNKPVIKKFKKRKVHSSFIDNIWGADLANMQLMSKFNKGIHLLLCVIDIFSLNTHGLKRGITTTNAFQKMLDESNCKPNKIWVDKDFYEFYNRSMKSWLERNAIEIYSTHNE